MEQQSIEGGEIELRNVRKTYGIGLDEKTIIQDCSFKICRNELTVMIGPSGCGKSTLVRLIAGFERVSGGTILSNGETVKGPGRDRLVVFQESALYPWMTTEQNILYGPNARGERGPAIRQVAKSVIDRVGLKQFRSSYPNQLSGGMQRRAELARAMINSPQVMILDEPFRGLDAMTKGLMQEYYAELFEESGRTHFFITTDIDEAIFLADRLLIMSNVPMQVHSIIEVDLPRPRRLSDILESDRANEIKFRAISQLHAEAMKAFAGGSRAATDFVEAYSRRLKA